MHELESVIALDLAGRRRAARPAADPADVRVVVRPDAAPSRHRVHVLVGEGRLVAVDVHGRHRRVPEDVRLQACQGRALGQAHVFHELVLVRGHAVIHAISRHLGRRLRLTPIQLDGRLRPVARKDRRCVDGRELAGRLVAGSVHGGDEVVVARPVRSRPGVGEARRGGAADAVASPALVRNEAWHESPVDPVASDRLGLAGRIEDDSVPRELHVPAGARCTHTGDLGGRSDVRADGRSRRGEPREPESAGEQKASRNRPLRRGCGIDGVHFPSPCVMGLNRHFPLGRQECYRARAAVAMSFRRATRSCRF